VFFLYSGCSCYCERDQKCMQNFDHNILDYGL
jgi:hypothetical protein